MGQSQHQTMNGLNGDTHTDMLFNFEFPTVLNMSDLLALLLLNCFLYHSLSDSLHIFILFLNYVQME